MTWLQDAARKAVRAYNLDGWDPAVSQPLTPGAPAFCQLCGQLSGGWAYEQGPQTVLCFGCYETSELAHRKFRWT